MIDTQEKGRHTNAFLLRKSSIELDFVKQKSISIK